MITKKDVLLLPWNCVSKGATYYKKQEVKLPEHTPLYVDFYHDCSPVGTVFNFRNTDDGIVADLSFEKEITNSVAPEMLVNQYDEPTHEAKGLELLGVSFVREHGFSRCENNLKGKEENKMESKGNFDHDPMMGKKVRDKVTGREGIVTGVLYSLFGCKQFVVNPGLDKDGKKLENECNDEGRYEVIGDGVRPKDVASKSGQGGEALSGEMLGRY